MKLELRQECLILIKYKCLLTSKLLTKHQILNVKKLILRY